MRAPAFWARAHPSILACALSPLGALYGAIVARRMARPGARCGVPVICIGNLTAGGAGKTPLAIAVARLLIDMGEAPVFLSRGYGGAHNGAPLHVDPARHTASGVGDEPLLLARIAPTVICADRLAGAKAAIVEGASIIVMDDGMQNPALQKDLTLAVVDGGVGFGNGMCMPAGPLRAPLAAQTPFIDALVVMGDGQAGDAIAARDWGKPVLRAQLAVESRVAETLRGARVVAFAGIGRPAKFFDTLTAFGADIVAQCAFPDHHRFVQHELDALAQTAKAQNAVLVTTEKDAVRLPGTFVVQTLPVSAQVTEIQALQAMLQMALARRGA